MSGGSVCQDRGPADLEAFLEEVRKVPNELALHCMLYISGKKGWFPHSYQFYFDTNVPFSPELGDDLFVLEVRRMIRDTREPNSLVYADPRPQPSIRSVLANLASMSVDELLLLSRIVYAEEKSTSCCLEDSAVHIFGMSREVVRRGVDTLRNLESKARSG